MNEKNETTSTHNGGAGRGGRRRRTRRTVPASAAGTSAPLLHRLRRQRRRRRRRATRGSWRRRATPAGAVAVAHRETTAMRASARAHSSSARTRRCRRRCRAAAARAPRRAPPCSPLPRAMGDETVSFFFFAFWSSRNTGFARSDLPSTMLTWHGFREATSTVSLSWAPRTCIGGREGESTGCQWARISRRM